MKKTSYQKLKEENARLNAEFNRLIELNRDIIYKPIDSPCIIDRSIAMDSEGRLENIRLKGEIERLNEVIHKLKSDVIYRMKNDRSSNAEDKGFITVTEKDLLLITAKWKDLSLTLTTMIILSINISF